MNRNSSGTAQLSQFNLQAPLPKRQFKTEIANT